MTYRHVFITGKPGVGKTTLVQRVLRRLGPSVGISGISTVEICNAAHERTGFRSFNVSDGNSVQIASKRSSEEPSNSAIEEARVGPYVVHVKENVAFARQAIERSIKTSPRSLMVLDEVGAMQCISTEYEEILARVLQGDEWNCFGTIPAKDLHVLPFVDHLRARRDVKVIEVTEETRLDVIEEAWISLIRILYPEDTASKILSKRHLSEIYFGELSTRLQDAKGQPLMIESGSGVLLDEEVSSMHFKGDHSTYLMRRLITSYSTSSTGNTKSLVPGGSTPLAPMGFECSCSFYSEWQICSHTLSLLLQNERHLSHLY